MAFDSFGEFLAMGKHGAFVWPTYGIVVLSLVAIHIAVRLRQKKLRTTLQHLKDDTKDTP